MLARRLRPKCRDVFLPVAVLLLIPASIEAQSSSVTLQATVSQTVALSILPNSEQGDLKMDLMGNGGNTVQVTLTGEAAAPVIRIPLLVRSNSAFKISAVFESQTAVVTQLSVIDVRPTGRLAFPEVVNAVAVRPEGDLDVSRPLLVLSGPRVSLGGTLNSPDNALQITLLIRLRLETGRRSLVHLTFTGTAGPPME